MSEGNKKLTFLIKKFCSSLNITEDTEDNINLLIQNILIQHKEFLRIPKSDFKENITKGLMDHLKPQKKDGNQSQSEVNSKLSVTTTPATPMKKRKRPQSTTSTEPMESAEDNMTSASSFLISRPTARLSDLAGLDNVIKQVREMVFFPIQLPELYQHLGVSPPSGLLLHGPSGCGKTTLASAIAGELGLPFLKASGPELIGGTSGESEQRIRELFDQAFSSAPSILFLDGLDVIAGKKEASQRGMDRRVVAQLFDSIDQIKTQNRSPGTDTVPETSNGHCRNKHVILIAATNRPDSLDTGVRGRFSREIALPVPDASARTDILKLVTKTINLAPDVDLQSLGKATPGYVGSDLYALASEAGLEAIRRIVQDSTSALSLPSNISLCEHHSEIFQHVVSKNASLQRSIPSAPPSAVGEFELTEESSEMERELNRSEESMILADPVDRTTDFHSIDPLSLSPPPSCFYCALANGSLSAETHQFIAVTMNDFSVAIKSVLPSAKREGFAVVPDVTWSDVGALSEVREELLHNVLEPIAHPERFLRLGLDVPAGVLFFGPPGCGKTLLAKALANQSGANFISVKGPELLNMYVGESESRVRQVFTRARASAPCVIFFDELDALCPKRGSGGEGGSGVSERVVNQLLTELDGLETRKDVYIIAATNRLELIDDAMLRPGRLGKLLYVPLPSAGDRSSILSAICRKVSIDTTNVNFESIASDKRAEGFSGADLAALVREAGMSVMIEWREKAENLLDVQALSLSLESISSRHFERAFQKVRPSVSPEDRMRYDLVHKFIREDGLGAIEALKAVSAVLEDRARRKL